MSTKISGDNVDLYIHRTGFAGIEYTALRAYNGGQIWLTNSDIDLTTFRQSYSYNDRVFMAKDAGTQVNIASSTLYSHASLGEVSNGASAVIDNSTVSAGLGVTVTGAGSRLDIINDSDITIRGDHSEPYQAGIRVTGGATLNIENSRITVLDNGYYSGATTPRNPEAIEITNVYTPNELATRANLNNLIIETKGYQSNAINVTSGNASAAMNNLTIVTRGLGAYGLYIDNTNNVASTISNSSIETFGYSGMGAFAVGKTKLTLDNVDITTHGYRSTGLQASVGGTDSNQPTILTASNIDIVMSGKDSRGVVNNEARTYLNDIRLTLSGDTSTALSVGTTGLETIARIDNLTALVSGNNSTGMFLGANPDITFNNNSINMTGNNSHGLQVGYRLLNSSSELPVFDSRIETRDGYAVQSINANLNLDLTRSVLTGRSDGETGIAVSVEDSGSFQSGVVNIAASDNSHIFGDAVSQSANAAALNLTLDTSSTMTGRIVRGYSMALDDTSRWNVTGDSDITTLDNSGTVAFTSPGDEGVFRTITVGNYRGGGTLIMNTALGDDSSATDRLIVTGDTAGTTKLYVNNFHGTGTTTVNGIEVISVGGQSDGLFTLENRALAGAYEYFLHQDDGDWYLRSALAPEPPTPEEPELPAEPEDPVEETPQPPQTPEQPGDTPPVEAPETPAVPTPEPTPAPVQKPQIYRPEAGAYLANMAAANRLFSHSLKDREGRAQDSSMWLRQLAFRSESHDGSGQLQMRGNSYVIQGGGELWNGQFSEQDRLGVGIMAGYGYSRGNTHSAKTHYDAKNSVHGYSTGAYATWYQNAESGNGLYVDSWLQYSWLRASVNGEGLVGESYNISGLSGSLESGYRQPLRQNINGALFITPQAQVIWSGIKADRHEEVNGTQVDGSGSVQTRLGLNLSYDALNAQTNGKQFTVYSEVNWLHNTHVVDVALDNVRVEQAGSRNVGEVKLGLEGQPTDAFTIWTNLAQRVGTESYRDTSTNVGIKYRF
ncbi:hypothetical protein GTGU_00434 [Trabulsiella guamensis ATCC 49490]|uniref:Autotransporter domain-containing protein n=1 Tax=Trabulsiella guamensis ATCC 49490 TaxID=1005994 RepID=A0A085AM24_9ENTR|nr:autotransporter outer membrane beta-barrel domain-containing protein [Trabulsiella guamensis]KFC11269.1 hypothetical protein GTGU_00434 [Trabulsiella guamensis ATCC 49490]